VPAHFYFQNQSAPVPNRGISLGICALIRKGDALLLEHRADADRWSLIGGALDLNESLADGIAREIREETGLTLTDLTLFGTFSDPSRIIAYPDGNVIRSVTMAYLVTVADDSVLRISEESRELRWVTLAELRSLPIAETHQQILDCYAAGAATPVMA